MPPLIPGFEFLQKLGEGGMSTVWKATELGTGKLVAIKVLNPELTTNPEDLALFQAEARVLSTINHPGIVKSYDLSCFEGLWYFTMEYVDGYTFGALLTRKQHLSEADCLLICESVAVALDYAWNEFGIVHCDLKPENIMINTDGVIKVMDLGLCHTFAYLKDGRQDVPDQVMGTPAYISPEQVYGDLEPDCRSDIYSLAASIYHLATGRMLFPGLDSEGMMRAHCSETTQARDPRCYRPQLSEGFCQLLDAMLVKNRDSRIASWKDIYTMCLDIEHGIAFKPRSGAPSSLALMTATGGNAAMNSPRFSTVPEPKKRVLKLHRERSAKAVSHLDAASGKIIVAKHKPAGKGFKFHKPAEWYQDAY